VKNEILINQLLEQDLNENNFSNLLLNSHELKLKKLMKDEINLFKSFIESQQYLSRRTADIILEEHHVIATIVYNNQSIISGSIQIVMNAYMTISQIQTVKETKIKTVFQMKKVLKKSRDHNEEKFQRLFGADYLWKATTEFRVSFLYLFIALNLLFVSWLIDERTWFAYLFAVQIFSIKFLFRKLFTFYNCPN